MRLPGPILHLLTGALCVAVTLCCCGFGPETLATVFDVPPAAATKATESRGHSGCHGHVSVGAEGPSSPCHDDQTPGPSDHTQCCGEHQLKVSHSVDIQVPPLLPAPLFSVVELVLRPVERPLLGAVADPGSVQRTQTSLLRLRCALII